MKKITLLILLLIMFSCAKKIYTSNEYFNCNKPVDFKIDTDKKQLIYKILNRAIITNRDIPDYQMIKDKKKIYILDTYYSAFFGETEIKSYPLNPANIPNQIGNVKFCLKSKTELQKIADKTEPFTYLTFAKININENIATIGIDNGWQGQTNGNTVYMSGGGYIWQFKKMNGTWEFDKILSHFQS